MSKQRVPLRKKFQNRAVFAGPCTLTPPRVVGDVIVWAESVIPLAMIRRTSS